MVAGLLPGGKLMLAFCARVAGSIKIKMLRNTTAYLFISFAFAHTLDSGLGQWKRLPKQQKTRA
jgi:hypothetical protein